MSYREVYEKWCNDPYFDEASREELKALEGNEAEIEDRFYRQLEFGTGGLRGVIGAGTNRMNIYTVRQATQGLANYIISQNGQEKGVAIAHDSRRMSPEFAREAALCLNANGIKTYLFESLRPTPELSFAVREFGCISGIVITASHNPREYNGYKVYWEDGAQITPPHDKNILAEVAKVTEFSAVKTMEEDDARAEGLFQVIGTDFDDRYVAKLKEQSIHPEIIKDAAKDMKIVYTPLHGTGNVPVRRVLRELGFNQVYVVKEQKVPDGNFPTVAYPNPEDEKAWTLALKLAKEVDADIILATDPDADLLGVRWHGDRFCGRRRSPRQQRHGDRVRRACVHAGAALGALAPCRLRKLRVARVDALLADAAAGPARAALRRFQALRIVDRGHEGLVRLRDQAHERRKRAQLMAPLLEQQHLGDKQRGHHDERPGDIAV